MTDNPWKLTPRETEVLAALTECGGSCKLVAAKTGKAKQTIDTLAHRAMRRMNAQTRIAALLEFDRWARAQA